MANCGRRNWQLQLRVGLPMSIQRAAHLWPLRGSRRLGDPRGLLRRDKHGRSTFCPRLFVARRNGTRLLIVDEAASPDQRRALLALESGTQGGIFFEIFAAMCPNVLEPIFAPITFDADRERRTARVIIPDVFESRIEPIRNPKTGEEHRARIVLPDGFEFKEAEVANTVRFEVKKPH